MADGRVSRWLGVAPRMVLTRAWSGSLDRSSVEAVIEICQTVAGQRGRVELMQTSATWDNSTGPLSPVATEEVRVVSRDGEVTLSLDDRRGDVLTFASMGGVLTLAAGWLGAAALAGSVAGVAVAAVGVSCIAMLARRWARNGRTTQVAAAQQLFEVLSEVIEQKLLPAAAQQTNSEA